MNETATQSPAADSDGAGCAGGLCRVPGCGKPVDYRGLCRWCMKLAKGYARGNQERAEQARRSMLPGQRRASDTCTVPGCDGKWQARGLCKACYAAALRGDTPKARRVLPYLLPANRRRRLALRAICHQAPLAGLRGQLRPDVCAVAGCECLTLDGPLCKRHLALARLGDPADAETQAAVAALQAAQEAVR